MRCRVTYIGRPLAGAVLVLSCALLNCSIWAQDAVNRGLLDSSVQTLVGGNIGDGSTTPTSVPLVNLRGGMAADSTGAIYFTESNRVMKLAGGTLSVFAGSQTSGYTESTKGAGARFANPRFLTSDPGNTIYVVDSGNSRIRKIAPDGTTTTVAGNGGAAAGIADIGRPAVDASLPAISGVAVNAGGDIFFISNPTLCLYKVPASTGLLTILAGNGSSTNLASGSVAINNSLGTPSVLGLAVLSDGTPIYSTANAIRNVKADGTNVVIAGVLDVNPAAASFNIPQLQTPLFPDDGSFAALQTFNSASGTPPNVLANVGGMTPGQLSVDGNTIYFLDISAKRIRSFTVGGTIQTVFGERSEGGQTTAGGFRGNNSPAATSTPRLGLVVTAGPDQILTTAAGADSLDATSRPSRIFSGADNLSSVAAAAGDDVLVVPSGTALADDQTPRNDDPKESCGINAQLVALNGVVTFSDDGNFLIRQFTVGGNVVTVAGDTVPFRVQNIGSSPAFPTQAISDGLPIPAANAAIFNPRQVARDAAGNIFFDANDDLSGGNHKIYKYDATAKTVTCIAGPVLTNGFRSNGGDGAPAANVPLTGLGAQVGVLSDGTLLFADTVPVFGASNNTVRAVSPAGVLSSIAGIPGVAGSAPPDVDQTIVNAAGNFVSTGRVGMKPTAVPFNRPNGVIGTTLNDFIVADSGNSRVVVVSAGLIAQDIALGITPVYLAQSGSNLFVASSTSGQVVKIDLSANPPTVSPNFISAAVAPVTVNGTSTTTSPTITAIASTAGLAPGDVLTVGAGGFTAGATIVSLSPTTVMLNQNSALGAAGVNFTFQRPVQAVRGLAIGTNGMFVLGTAGNVSLITTASLSTAAGVVQYSFAATTGFPTGLAVSGTTVAFSENNAGAGDIKQFTDTGTLTPAPAVTQVAGAFTNVVVNGFNLQAHFGFTTFAPLAISGTNFISGDDSVTQFRVVTPVAPAPNSTATVLAGAGSERNGGVDGEVATNATDIGQCGGIAVDSTGAVFFSDQGVNTIRRISNNLITTIAGVPVLSPPSLATVVDGPALKTIFHTPAGLGFKPGDDSALLVCDQANNVVRKISPTDGTGMVTRFAGVVGDGAGDGGDGSLAVNARLQQPIGVVFDPNGDVYIAEGGSSGSRVHVVSTTGIMTQFGGGGADRPTYTPIPAIEVDLPSSGITIDAGGKVYLPSGGSQGFISRIAGGNAQIVVGDPLLGGFNGDGLPGFATLLSGPTSATYSPALGLVFSDSSNGRVRAVANLAEATNTGPTARIVASPDHLGMAPFKVVLDGSTSTDDDGDIVTYSWDFGDGTLGFGPKVEKVYPIMGEYVVTLLIIDTAAHASTTQTTVFSAIPILASDTSGKGSFNVGFGSKANNDSVALQIKNVHNLKPENGKPFTLFIGSFSVTGTMGGKGVKAPKKSALDLLTSSSEVLTPLATKPPKPPKKSKTTVTASIDPAKGTVSINLKGASLAAAFASFGVGNENTIGGRSALVPVVVSVNSGELVIGDRFQFDYKGKFNGNAQGKFSQ